MELIIFHYHFRPGGVTSVVRQGIESLFAGGLEISVPSDVSGTETSRDFDDSGKTDYRAEIRAIRLVAGNDEGSDKLVTYLRNAAPKGVSVTFHLVPQIGYISRTRLAEFATADADDKDRDEEKGPVGQVSVDQVQSGCTALADRIKDRMHREFGGTDRIWWIHNYHIGKNPAFTKAVVEMVTSSPSQPILLHVHDFPESGRYTNLHYLHQSGLPSLYPTGATTAYATINIRDQKILERAGVGPVFYLGNPVLETETAQGTVSAPSVRSRLHETFFQEFPGYTGTEQIVLYPVRTIRRKNVLEAAFLVELAGPELVLVVTLPGVSDAEHAYSELVKTAFQNGIVRGLWGIGEHLDRAGISFSDLVAAADIIISTSVQEGFGYQYVSALMNGKPLIARKIDVMDDIEPLFGGYPHAFYNSVRVPASSPGISDPKSFLQFRYSERIARLKNIVSESVLTNLERSVEAALSGPTLEFSFLMPQMQYAYLKDIAQYGPFRDQVRSLNADILQALSTLVVEPTEPQPQRVAQAFGPQPYGSRVRNAIRSLLLKASSDTQSLDVYGGAQDTGAALPDEVVLEAFATLPYQRLLYE